MVTSSSFIHWVLASFFVYPPGHRQKLCKQICVLLRINNNKNFDQPTVTMWLTHTVPQPIILVKSTMVQSTGTNNIGRDWYTIPLNFNNGPVPRCAQLMLWSGFQWVKIIFRLRCYIENLRAQLQRNSKICQGTLKDFNAPFN